MNALYHQQLTKPATRKQLALWVSNTEQHSLLLLKAIPHTIYVDQKLNEKQPVHSFIDNAIKLYGGMEV